MLEHLGIYFDNDVIKYEASIIPDPLQGKYSFKNVFGEEVIRKDLPKETHYTEIESPNWGIALTVHILLDYLTINTPET